MVPEALAEHLHHQVPEIHPPDAHEAFTILKEIADLVREELDAAGIIPGPIPGKEVRRESRAKNAPVQRLNARERRHAADFAALLVWISEAAAHIALSLMSDAGRQEGMKEEALEFAREAVGWGAIANDPAQLGICITILAVRLHLLKLEFDEAEKTFRQGILLLEGKEDEEARRVRLHLLLSFSRLFVEWGRHDDAEKTVKRALDLITTDSAGIERGKRVLLLMTRGEIATRRNEFAAALAYGQQALRWSDPEFDPIGHCALLQSLAIIYRHMQHPEEGLKLLLTIITILESHGLVGTGAWSYITTSEVYHQLGELDRALEVLDRVEELLGISHTHLPENPERITLNIFSRRADVLIAQGETEEARKLLAWAIEKSHAIGFYMTEVATCAMMATICGHGGDPKLACRYLLRAYDVSTGSSRSRQLRLLLQLAAWRIECGELREAEELLDEIGPELQERNDFRIRLLRYTARLREKEKDPGAALQCEREAADIERELLENKRERSIRFARIVAETNVLEHSVEQEKERRRRLEHELAEAVVKLGEREKLLETVRDKVKEGIAKRQKGKSQNPDVVLLRSLLATLNDGKERSDSPLNYLGSAGDEFIRRLRIAYPSLNATQERLCILLRAGLNATEICTLLGIGSEGLKSRRKRLRKTLGVPQGESLEKVIAEV